MLGTFSRINEKIENKFNFFLIYYFQKAQNLEGAYKLKGNPLTNISVEQIVDCDGTSKPSTAQSDCGVFGGWPFLAFQYIQRQVKN